MSIARSFFLAPDDPPSKQAILKAALTTFARDGVAGTSVRAIAQHAGYTNPALFKFFRTKDDLALYLFERCYTECLLVLQTAMSPRAGFRAKLRAALVALTTFVDVNPEAFFFVQDNLRVYWPKLPREARKTSMMGEFRALVELGRREGRASTAIPIELQLAAMIGFLVQLARMNHFKELKPGITSRIDETEAMILVILRP